MNDRDPGASLFRDGIPHSEALGMTFVGRDGPAQLFSLDWRDELVGHPDSGSIHSSVVFSLLDYCLGMCCFTAVSPGKFIATIDLRVDYTRPSERGRQILVRAECFRTTRQVAFARGVAYHDDPDTPLAVAQGTFMISDAAEVLAGKPA